MDLKRVNKKLHHYIAVCLELMDTHEVDASWKCWESLDDQHAVHAKLKEMLAHNLMQLGTAKNYEEAIDIINDYILKDDNYAQ